MDEHHFDVGASFKETLVEAVLAERKACSEQAIQTGQDAGECYRRCDPPDADTAIACSNTGWFISHAILARGDKKA